MRSLLDGGTCILQGTITRVGHGGPTADTFHVEYDDGEAHDENLKQESFRWHGPRSSSDKVCYRPAMRAAMLLLGAENVTPLEVQPEASFASVRFSRLRHELETRLLSLLCTSITFIALCADFLCRALSPVQ
jgi:hypothetical protein